MNLLTKIYCFFLLCLLLSSCVFQSRERRAQKKLAKQKYEKAEQLLDKSLRKDSLNPAAHYLFSQLYLDTAYLQQIDTAQYHILKALNQLDSADKKDLKRLRKIEADSAELYQQLARVDSAAFRRAKEMHSIAGYNYFLEQYGYAPQVDEAIRRRNALAFRAAEEEHTYQAYQAFLELYPQAIEAPEARERYEELLFIASTRTGTLDAYIRFLAAYPETPYRGRLLKNIFQLSTAGHQPAQYAAFIRNYPDNTYAREALNQLYHMHKEEKGAESFLQTYPQLPFQDSLRQVIALEDQLFLAVLSQQNWKFLNQQGTLMLDSLDDVHPDYLCQAVTGDYLEVSRNMQPLLLAKNGHLLLQEDYERVEDVGLGMLRLHQNSLQGLLFKSGKTILPPAYEQVERLGPDFFRAKEWGKFGLLTHNGQWLLEPTHDSLSMLEDFVLVYRDSLLAVSTIDTLIHALQQKQPYPLEFIYKDALLADSTHLLVQNLQNQQSVLNKQLKQPLPFTEGSIKRYKGGWLVEEGGRYYVLDQEGRNILNATLRRAVVREPWIAYKTDSLWGLYHIPKQQATFDLFDSLAILHPGILVAHKDGQQSALFFGKDTTMVDLSGTDSYRLLRSGQGSRDDTERVYLLVQNGNAKLIYNQQGSLIHQGRYKEVVAPDNRLLLLKSAKGTAIADSSGKLLLKPQYDAVGNYQEGYFATLSKSRFGTFNPFKNVLIPPQYAVALRPYSDSLLLANKKGDWGIIDLQNKKVTGFEWEEISYWSDSVMLARKEGDWQLVHLFKNEVLHGPFEDVSFIRQSTAESMAIVYSPEGYGVYSSTKGVLISPAYDDIINLGSTENPLFYAEKKVEEADLYVVVYINAKGETIFKEAYPREEWFRLLCD